MPKNRQTQTDSCESQNDNASSGNRTRAARVAGEHSTTEPTMLDINNQNSLRLKFNMHNSDIVGRCH